MHTHEKSLLLDLLETLDRRMILSGQLLKDLSNYRKGYQGELTAIDVIENLVTADYLVLSNLLLTINNNTCQMDVLVLTSDCLYLYEVKNYTGSFTNNGNAYLSAFGTQYVSPLNQLETTTVYLKQLLRQLGADISVKSYVLFVNPLFTLYQAKEKDPIILPSQIDAHFNGLNHHRNKLPQRFHILAEQLKNLNQSEANFQRKLPVYTFDDLKKGFICLKCGSFNIETTQRICCCLDCHTCHSLQYSVLKHIEEYSFLFPNKKITTALIDDWCGGCISKHIIRKVLFSHYKKKGSARATYYE